MRTCIGCRRRTEAAGLVRVVRLPDGALGVGRTLGGRGAWLCPRLQCVDLAERRKAFGRALRAHVEGDAVQRLRVLPEFRERMVGRDAGSSRGNSPREG